MTTLVSRLINAAVISGFATLTGFSAAAHAQGGLEDLQRIKDHYEQKQQLLAELATIEANKLAFATAIANNWQGSAEAWGYDIPSWREEFTGLLMGASAQDLASIAELNDYNRVIETLVGFNPGQPHRVTEGVTSKALGDPKSDLVYIPLVPCRLYDSRFAQANGGQILPANSLRTISSRDESLAFQGGNFEGCGLPSGTEMDSPADAVAIAYNITVTQYVGSGLVKVYPANESRPNASTINYDVTNLPSLANSSIVTQCVGCGDDDLSIWVEAAATHVIIDVLGYFNPPAPTPLETLFVTKSIRGSGTFEVSTDECPVGYSLTGGGIITGELDNAGNPVNIATRDSHPLGRYWRCQAQLYTFNATANLSCYAICSRVPGK